MSSSDSKMSVVQNSIKPFDGSGYSNWEFRVKLLLEHHGVLEVLSQTVPTDPVELDKFKKTDLKARNLLVNCLSDTVLEMIKSKTTAKEIIDTLKGTYLKSGVASQVQLQRKLRNMKFNGREPLNVYILEFEKTVSELKNAGGKIEDTEVISQLLASMPESYQSVVTALDVLFCQDNKSVTFDFVKSKLLFEETRQTKDEEETSSSAFVGQNTKRYEFRKKKFPYRCYSCGKKGHKRSDCPGKSKANVTEKENEDEVCFITTESGEALSSQIKSGSIEFVVDSGATNHLIKSEFSKYLSDTKNVNFKIQVAKKGQGILGKIQGNLHLQTKQGQKILIRDVVVCDSLSHNLLAVRKLEERGLKLIFENNCVKRQK